MHEGERGGSCEGGGYEEVGEVDVLHVVRQSVVCGMLVA